MVVHLGAVTRRLQRLQKVVTRRAAWLIHGALNPWGFSTGRYGECAYLLLGAGARVEEASLPTGHDEVDRVLREHFVRG